MRTFISGLLAGLIVLTNFSGTSATLRRSGRAKHAALSKRAPDWPVHYWETKIRGVSLAGWLVLEPWITPSIFTSQDSSNIVDEYTLSQYGNRDVVQATLADHWNTFITKDDFQKIKDAGLNHVKIPIGYWAWDISQGEPYHQGQLFYLNQAVGWARDLGLKIIITLQGLPGSQNGFDGSGQKGDISWHKNKQNIDRSSNIVKTLATWYSAQTDVVVAIESIASPAGWVGDDFMNVLRQYYLDSYGNIRYPYATASQGAIVQIIPDAGLSLSSWKGFEPPGSFDGVMIDTHYYSIWCPDCPSRSYDQHIAAACQQNTSLAESELWTVVGEWTTSTTDCANLQFGPMGGSTYDGTAANSVKHGDCSTMTGDGSKFSQDYKNFMRAFFEAQTSTFEANSVGWIYNTWKSENATESSYSAGLAGGWIPSVTTDRAYPNVCSGTPLANLTTTLPVTNVTSPNNTTIPSNTTTLCPFVCPSGAIQVIEERDTEDNGILSCPVTQYQEVVPRDNINCQYNSTDGTLLTSGQSASACPVNLIRPTDCVPVVNTTTPATNTTQSNNTTCATGPIQCCQSVAPPTSGSVAALLKLLGVVVQDVSILMQVVFTISHILTKY
ncbi:hypothetical protein VNI00_011002 [Paramarasmius palmivorus]|uniref:Glycoside hydrolase family 5 domain-containing protein n=1 Tax=Paramarasmius palmivorus TaxID=297713 RepID=A0AAW0CEQ0_9AGAR